MIRYITIYTSALMLLASHASATEFEGRMDCKVKSNKILEIEEGIEQEYSGLEKEFKTGEALKLTYGINNSGEPFILLKDEVRDHETYKVMVNLTNFPIDCG